MLVFFNLQNTNMVTIGDTLNNDWELLQYARSTAAHGKRLCGLRRRMQQGISYQHFRRGDDVVRT